MITMIAVLKKNPHILLLMVAGVLFLPSACLGPKALGVVLAFFLVGFGWGIAKNFGFSVFSNLGEDAYQKAIQAKENRDGKRMTVYMLVFPMMMVGLLVVFIMLGCLFFYTF